MLKLFFSSTGATVLLFSLNTDRKSSSASDVDQWIDVGEWPLAGRKLWAWVSSYSFVVCNRINIGAAGGGRSGVFIYLTIFRPPFGFFQSCRSRNFLLGEPVKKSWARICVELWHFSFSVFLGNLVFRFDLDKSSTIWIYIAFGWIRTNKLIWALPFSGRMARTLSISCPSSLPNLPF